MNALDERARRAAASARRLAETVDAEEVLGRIEGRQQRAAWFRPVMALGSLAAVAVVVIGALNLLGDNAVRIDNEPGVVGTPDGAATTTWPPAGAQSEDGWIHLDPEAHGIDGLPADVVAFQDGFLLVDSAGRIWGSSDGISWENRAGLNIPNADLVVDRGRVVAMGVVNDGRELRVSWSTDGDNWTTVENRGQLSVSVGESQWFEPQLVAGPRGFVIAANVWMEQAPGATVTRPANEGATIRVLESPDGAAWSSTVEWGNTGVANLTGLAGDTNGYTLVFQGDDLVSEVDKGTARVFTSGDSTEWTSVDGHPGGRPVRLERAQPAPFIGDGDGGDDLVVPGLPLHTWEFSIGEPFQGGGVWLRTASGAWEQATFEGAPSSEPGWYVTQIWDGSDALYANLVRSPGSTSTVYRSDDGYLWTALDRDPVFTDARLAGNGVVAASNGRVSLFALACCVEGVFDRNTNMQLWVRYAPQQEDAGPDPQPTAQQTEPAECGTEGLSGEPEPQAGLPDPVQTMRVEIASAAVSCNYGLLAELAGDTFTASFGGVDDVEQWFRDADMRTLRMMLDLPWATVPDSDPPIYAWPSAFVDGTDEAWQALYDAGLATTEDRASMEEYFDGWVGHRHGITADGDWVFYVAGD